MSLLDASWPVAVHGAGKAPSHVVSPLAREEGRWWLLTSWLAIPGVLAVAIGTAVTRTLVLGPDAYAVNRVNMLAAGRDWLGQAELHNMTGSSERETLTNALRTFTTSDSVSWTSLGVIVTAFLIGSGYSASLWPHLGQEVRLRSALFLASIAGALFQVPSLSPVSSAMVRSPYWEGCASPYVSASALTGAQIILLGQALTVWTWLPVLPPCIAGRWYNRAADSLAVVSAAAVMGAVWAQTGVLQVQSEQPWVVGAQQAVRAILYPAVGLADVCVVIRLVQARRSGAKWGRLCGPVGLAGAVTHLLAIFASWAVVEFLQTSVAEPRDCLPWEAVGGGGLVPANAPLPAAGARWPEGLDPLNPVHMARVRSAFVVSRLLAVAATVPVAVMAILMLIDSHQRLGGRRQRLADSASDRLRNAIAYVSHEARGPLNAASLGLAVLDDLRSTHAARQERARGERRARRGSAHADAAVRESLIADVAASVQAASRHLDDLLRWEDAARATMDGPAATSCAWALPDTEMLDAAGRLFGGRCEAAEVSLLLGWREVADAAAEGGSLVGGWTSRRRSLSSERRSASTHRVIDLEAAEPGPVGPVPALAGMPSGHGRRLVEPSPRPGSARGIASAGPSLQVTARSPVAAVRDVIPLSAGPSRVDTGRPPSVVGPASRFNESVTSLGPGRRERPAVTVGGVDVATNDATEVLCDHDLLLAVLHAALSNAVKFTPPGGEVRAVFTVRDTGPGIARSLIESGELFEPFKLLRRGDSSMADSSGGMGLAIAQALVVGSLRGQVGVSSNGRDGTVFFARVPVWARASNAPSPAASAGSRVVMRRASSSALGPHGRGSSGANASSFSPRAGPGHAAHVAPGSGASWLGGGGSATFQHQLSRLRNTSSGAIGGSGVFAAAGGEASGVAGQHGSAAADGRRRAVGDLSRGPAPASRPEPRQRGQPAIAEATEETAGPDTTRVESGASAEFPDDSSGKTSAALQRQASDAMADPSPAALSGNGGGRAAGAAADATRPGVALGSDADVTAADSSAARRTEAGASPGAAGTEGGSAGRSPPSEEAALAGSLRPRRRSAKGTSPPGRAGRARHGEAGSTTIVPPGACHDATSSAPAAAGRARPAAAASASASLGGGRGAPPLHSGPGASAHAFAGAEGTPELAGVRQTMSPSPLPSRRRSVSKATVAWGGSPGAAAAAAASALLLPPGGEEGAAVLRVGSTTARRMTQRRSRGEEAGAAGAAGVGGRSRSERAARRAAKTRRRTRHKSSSSASLPPRLLGRAAMVVEDERTNRTLLGMLLRRWGLRAAELCDGQEAVEALAALVDAPAADWPVIITLDVEMPRLDGFGVLARIKEMAAEWRTAGRVTASARLLAMPVLVLTGNAQARDREELARLGAARVLPKPVEAPKLAEAIAAVTGKA